MLSLKKSMACRVIVSLGFVFCASVGLAQQRVPIKKVEAPELSDLIKESESLAILKEESVQERAEESKRFYSVKLGLAGTGQVIVGGKTQNYQYDLGSETPVLGASFGVVPWKGAYEGGVEFSLSYLTKEGQGVVDQEEAQIHFLLLEPSLFVQGNQLRYFVPRLGFGYGLAAVFQRGFRDENTSTSRGFGFGYGAVDFKVSELLKADLEWALTLEHRQNFGSKSSLSVSDLQKTTLGFTLSL